MKYTLQTFSNLWSLTAVMGDVTNIILDPLLMFAFRLGVSGAAIAHIISQWVHLCLLLFFDSGCVITDFIFQFRDHVSFLFLISLFLTWFNRYLISLILLWSLMKRVVLLPPSIQDFQFAKILKNGHFLSMLLIFFFQNLLILNFI